MDDWEGNKARLEYQEKLKTGRDVGVIIIVLFAILTVIAIATRLLT